MKTLIAIVLVLAMCLPVAALQIVYPYVSNDATPVFGSVNIKSTVTQTIVAAQGNAVRTYVTQIQCVNPTSNSVILNVYDGGNAVTGGTIKTRLACPTAVGGASPLLTFVPPLKMSANTVINVGIGTTTIAAGGGDGLYIVLNGYTGR